MTVVEIIQKKVNKKELTQEEIEFIVNGIVNKTIPDYLLTSWLMAIYINKMSYDEAYYLTKAMYDCGAHIDLRDYKDKPIIDKHSTGGIGDKVTLILSPIVASLGIAIAKISGRGLGFTGGTIDKLEAVGVNTALTVNQMVSLLKKNGLFVAGQTLDIAPADKVLYNLRDVTGTVANYGLIASSILSKKFSILGTHVFLDVKYGSGAFCSTYKEAMLLIKYLKAIAKRMRRKLTIVVSSMIQPLGKAIGNAIEVREAQDFLKGNVDNYPDLKELIYKFASIILMANKKKLSLKEAMAKVDQVVKSGKALNKFYEWIESQGGDIKSLKEDKYFHPKYRYEVKAPKSGYLTFTSTSEIGLTSSHLGAGRILKTDVIDMQAGICFHKKYGEWVEPGDIVAICYSSKPISKKDIEQGMSDSCKLVNSKPKKIPVIKKVISDEEEY